MTQKLRIIIDLELPGPQSDLYLPDVEVVTEVEEAIDLTLIDLFETLENVQTATWWTAKPSKYTPPSPYEEASE